MKSLSPQSLLSEFWPTVVPTRFFLFIPLQNPVSVADSMRLPHLSFHLSSSSPFRPSLPLYCRAPRQVQAVVLAYPMGVNRLVEMLADRREVIRNEMLLMLEALTLGNENIKKIVAFEGYSMAAVFLSGWWNGIG
jgi:hypothetical protein